MLSAIATATVVLPMPPGPTIVNRRRLANCVPNSPTMPSRPTMRVSGVGRLLLAPALSGAVADGFRSRSRVTGATKL
jgi:hypothetical protein